MLFRRFSGGFSVDGSDSYGTNVNVNQYANSGSSQVLDPVLQYQEPGLSARQAKRNNNNIINNNSNPFLRQNKKLRRTNKLKTDGGWRPIFGPHQQHQ